MTSKKIIGLITAMILITLAIIFLELQKPSVPGGGDIEVEELTVIPEEGHDTISEEPDASTISEQQEKLMPDMPKEPEEIERTFTQEDIERIEQKAEIYNRAIELVDPNGYINTDMVKVADHIGQKVILIDFWTYSCINCQRTLPYLTSWYEKYRDDGFIIIGVHTPEFNFERDYNNVKKATEKFGVEYPVALDNNYYTWRAYRNRYWPRKYLIDIDGFIVFDHIGEGAYRETEEKIQELLKERKDILGVEEEIEEEITTPEEAASVSFSKIKTPEIYFGTNFARGGTFGNPEGLTLSEVISYSIPEEIEKHRAYVEGDWRNQEDYLKLESDSGMIVLVYEAKSVNIVAGADQETEISVNLDGEPVQTTAKGADILQDNEAFVQEFGLYNIIETADYGEHRLEIAINKPGLRIYTFTFG